MSRSVEGLGMGLALLGAVITCGAAVLLVTIPARLLRQGASLSARNRD
ncbi:hypothetical protein [Paraburkholderia caribensis]